MVKKAFTTLFISFLSVLIVGCESRVEPTPEDTVFNGQLGDSSGSSDRSNFQNSGSKLNLNILKETIKNNQNSLLGITNQFLNNNKNNFTSYSNRVNSATKLLESLSYKSVIKRGFAVIRNSSNKVIGKKTDIIRDNKLSIETKFGIIKAEIKDE